MLASPGHSPRNILRPPSPSRSSRSVSSDVSYAERFLPHASTSGKLLTRPPLSKKRKVRPIALDEDTYVAAVEKIIERDFFPDIPKLQNRLELLEAVRTGDPTVIREAQLNVVRRKLEKERGKGSFEFVGSANEPVSTPNSFSSAALSPSMSSIRSPPAASQVLMDAEHNGPLILNTTDSSPVDTSISLDTFLARYTSEDNASFSKILEKANKEKMGRYHFLSKDLVSTSLKITNEVDRTTDGFGTSGQPESTLETWSYKAKNFLMYSSADRDDFPLTQREKEGNVEGPPKEIVRINTRFHGKMFDWKVREEDRVAILYTPVLESTPTAWPFAERDAERARKRYDLEDLRKTPQALRERETGLVKGSSHAALGYGFVTTPSITPGVEESPFMTWGEIEGTPLRLDAEDNPLGIGGTGDGPQFKIPAPPSRDARAHSLSRDAARNLREKSKLFRGNATLSPGGGSASPAIKNFSAAAQKFVSKAMAKSYSAVDARLRASYRANSTPGTPRLTRNNNVRVREGSVPSRECSVALRSPSIVRESSVPLRLSPARPVLS